MKTRLLALWDLIWANEFVVVTSKTMHYVYFKKSQSGVIRAIVDAFSEAK